MYFFQLFAEEEAAAMEIYSKDSETHRAHPDLKDSQSTVDFIRRIQPLIKVMMLRSAKEGLKMNSKEHQVKSFIILAFRDVKICMKFMIFFLFDTEI